MDKQYDPNTNIAYISRTKRYIDEDGNEGTQTEVYKKTYGGKHFWRVWLGDLLYTLGLINNSKQLDVVFYVLDNTDPANNLYIGTIRKTVEETGVSLGTVSAIFKKMQDVDMIVKQQNGVYKVKPNLLMKGDDSKKQRLVIEYEKIKREEEQKHERPDDRDAMDEN
ncbi:replication/maintenance protein RepL [Intestinibacillus sp. Marseille-P6563]|uniref:replication/maintenance protein RepL n=1 Tax=Intestinibacillus sp. Marseille-P6563 TaxID=2364792 RepID=UPI000F0611F6|nr:replication/maintenance protein RepL [Intestinibacillus sp. Marseille-P6563]